MDGDAGSVVSLTKLVLPHRLFVENVEGVMKAYSKTDPDTAYGVFEDAMRAVRRPDGSQHFTGIAIISFQASVWVKCSRYRTHRPKCLQTQLIVARATFCSYASLVNIAKLA